MVCSAADSTLDCGALTTITPRAVAAATSTLSSPMPARPTTTRSVPASSTSAVTVVAERMIRACAPVTSVEQLLGRRPELDVDVVAGGAEPVEAAVGDRLGDQDAGHGLILTAGPTRPPTRRRCDVAAQLPAQPPDELEASTKKRGDRDDDQGDRRRSAPGCSHGRSAGDRLGLGRLVARSSLARPSTSRARSASSPSTATAVGAPATSSAARRSAPTPALDERSAA